MSIIAMDINKKIKHILPDNYQLGGYVAKKNYTWATRVT